ncbi:MAG: glycosyltransferase family 2 protein [bacterium]
MKTLSIVVPAFNEGPHLAEVLRRVFAVDTERLGYAKEIVVVDDGSKDDTRSVAESVGFARVLHQENRGKGAAVQHGVREATGDFVLVQDADLEYDPSDYRPMLEALRGEDRVAVYGSRPLGVLRDRGWRWPTPARHPRQGLGPWGMNILLSTLTLALYGRWLTDLLTAYKIYPTSFLRSITVETAGFETDHELTAKLIHQGIPIREVPIAYVPRSVEEGKKIRAIDGLIAIQTLLRYRFR